MVGECKFLGLATGGIARDPGGCRGCGSTPAPLYACSLRGETTFNQRVNGYTSCLRCSDFVAKPGATQSFAEFGPGLADPLPGPIRPREDWTWHTRMKTTDQHLEALRTVARMDFGKPAFTDDFGLIYIGEDNRSGLYGSMCLLGIHMARESGYTGPIEWWYNSRRGTINRKAAEGLGDVRFRDVTTVTPKPRMHSGWLDKSIPFLHSAFLRAGRFDADCYAVGDLGPIIQALKDGEINFGYWEELSKVVWSRVWPDGPGAIPPPQGGQIFVDRVAAWPILCTAAWMDLHADYYYAEKAYERAHKQHRLYQWGDQVSVHVSMRSLEEAGRLPKFTCYGPPRTVAQCQEYDFEGKTILVHRVGDKLRKDWSPLPGGTGEALVAKLWKKILSDSEPKSIVVAAQEKNGYGLPPGWNFRTRANDHIMFREVATQNEYEIGAITGSVLDVGANTGAFSWLAKQHGSRRIVGVEPHPETFRLYKSNCGSFAECHEIALAIHPANGMKLRDNARDGKGVLNTGMASLAYGTGIAVRIEAFDDFVAREFGDEEVEVLKLDCEGPEIGILLGSARLGQFREIKAEIHAGKGAWDAVTGEIAERLQAIGFEITKCVCHWPDAGQGHLFAKRG